MVEKQNDQRKNKGPIAFWDTYQPSAQLFSGMHPHLTVDRMTDTWCKNLTFTQLRLRVVKMFAFAFSSVCCECCNRQTECVCLIAASPARMLPEGGQPAAPPQQNTTGSAPAPSANSPASTAPTATTNSATSGANNASNTEGATSGNNEVSSSAGGTASSGKSTQTLTNLVTVRRCALTAASVISGVTSFS